MTQDLKKNYVTLVMGDAVGNKLATQFKVVVTPPNIGIIQRHFIAFMSMNAKTCSVMLCVSLFMVFSECIALVKRTQKLLSQPNNKKHDIFSSSFGRLQS